ncbi:hypothetical protein [Lentzea flava]|uniref:Phage shock protein C (PspC) family protein n=1 Tax=Lentzea flava TaxID=103732 RepID=A0ABQ2UG21_9PSEU|nr:hypothetical protein [Lentzea flava]MCP2198086.1 hypothetical protein [Lentzea flava]GGU24547.1 hypothetical protein GCM10010178_16050 [Lentzea flava]
MATSNPVVRYLASWKNLAGCAGGLLGLGLHFAGLAGSYWVLVVIGLYGVGALAAPPERIILVTDPEEEAGQLRTELDALVNRVRGFGGRVPGEVAPRLGEIAEVLRGMLNRPRELRADPDALHAVTRLVGTDLPLSIQTYLNLPWWYAAARGSGAELVRQLDLLLADAVRVAERFHAADAQRQADHTRYLEDRE